MRNGFWQLAYDWQSLVAGILALGAGVVAYCGAADQAKVARDQIAQSQKSERRRIARESHAFAETLRASTALVVEEAGEALKLFPNVPPGDPGQSPEAYAARQRISKTGFSDLRVAFIRLGGELTEQFFRLNAQIDHFADQWMTPSRTTSDMIRFGKHYGFNDQLNQIIQLARSLEEEAVKQKQRWNEILMQDHD
jgi:hypothetical protein